MSFSDDIQKFTKKTNGAALKVFRGTCIDMFSRIVRRTPVGNPELWASDPPPGYVGGRLRANWQMDINSASTETTGSTVSSTLPEIANIAALKLTDSVFIVNNLPYAKPVEDGWSSQAPAGMVKVTVAEFKNVVKKNI